jgi:hypothetical protein
MRGLYAIELGFDFGTVLDARLGVDDFDSFLFTEFVHPGGREGRREREKEGKEGEREGEREETSE